jgi:hypothetical protein
VETTEDDRHPDVSIPRAPANLRIDDVLAREVLRLADLEHEWCAKWNLMRLDRDRLVKRVRELEAVYDKLLAEAKDDAHLAEVAAQLAGDRIAALEEENRLLREALGEAKGCIAAAKATAGLA